MPSRSPATILANARLVLADRVVHGSVVLRDGLIEAVDEGPSAAAGTLDFAGDYLVPGLVELHTDHLENHYAPRPGVRWNPIAAIQAHDAQVAASGITTVFDALRVGGDADATTIGNDTRTLAAALDVARAEGRLRIDHFLHLRCEVPAADVVADAEPLIATGRVRLASLMDHTPGQRQFVSLAEYRKYYQAKAGFSDAEMDAYVAERQEIGRIRSAANRPRIAAMGRDAGLVLASHDDATPEHVAEAVSDGATIAEFPTTLEAAYAARDAGLKILMGAPNVVRGGSHSGNVSAVELAEVGLLDILSSDYVPFSLMQAAFLLPERIETMPLERAIALVTRGPAAAVGLDDRGEIAPGRRGDLVRVEHRPGSVPVVRSVWSGGERVG